jgi:hypothetical protein
MDRRRALVIAVEVMALMGKCKVAFPSAYEHIMSGIGIADEELVEAKELLQKEVEKEKLRGMAT